MLINHPSRRFSRAFKLQLCAEIRAGAIGRREAQRQHRLSGSLIQLWLGEFDSGLLSPGELPEDCVADQYEKRIAMLEIEVGRLTREGVRLRAALARATASNDDLPVAENPPAARRKRAK